jgi:hypothetical protein
MIDFRPVAALLALGFLAGCGGPTRTAGTRGLAAEDLSVFSLAQLPPESPVQIRAIRFDGAGDEYEVGKRGRDFYLLPRDHTASFTLTARLPEGGGRIAGMFIPEDALTLPSPRDIPLGTLEAGKTYELVRPAEDFAKMLQGGRLSLVREKGK